MLLVLLGSQPCHAAKLKAYVSTFAVSTPENRDELKTALQTLLMSRLNSEEIRAVDNQAEADIQIAASYIAFGTVFSLDALVKTNSGEFIDRVFVQGDAQNELIPSVVEMARRLQRALIKWNPALTAKAVSNDPLPAPVVKAASPVAVKIPPAPVKKAVPPEAKPATVAKARLPEPAKPPYKPWVSQRLPEILNGIATGRTRVSGETEIFITGEHYLGFYLKGETLQFLSEIVFEADEKVVGVDVADLEHNGTAALYVSILKNGLSASQVFIPEKNVLRKIGDNLPYLLRGIALEGNGQKIFAQKTDATGNFSGDVYELVKKGDVFSIKNPLQLPLFGNLYNFNRFTGAKGGKFFVVTHPDGYLLVYSKDKKQLWKSREKFGGRETNACPPTSTDPASPLQANCTFAPPQRLQVTATGKVIVSRNTGLTTSGARRSYSKNSVVQLSWNGTSLQETGRTEQSHYYLADYSYDDQNDALLLLEVEPNADQPEERGSRIVATRVK
jgi:hypothetical protein